MKTQIEVTLSELVSITQLLRHDIREHSMRSPSAKSRRLFPAIARMTDEKRRLYVRLTHQMFLPKIDRWTNEGE